jgi:hypothetical protein
LEPHRANLIRTSLSPIDDDASSHRGNAALHRYNGVLYRYDEASHWCIAALYRYIEALH